MNNEKPMMGLDIGSNAIRAVYLSRTKLGFKLEFVRYKKVPTLFTENGSVMDFGELVHAIKDIIGSDSFPDKRVAISLKGTSVVTKRVCAFTEHLNDMNEEFRWVAGNYSSIDPEEMSIDFKVIGQSNLYNHTDILLVGARRDVVTDFDSIITSANLNLSVVEPESLTLERLYTGLNLPKQNVTMIIHVGYAGSLVMFLKNERFDFSGDMQRGGKSFTEALKAEFDIDYDMADKIKTNPDLHEKPAEVRAVLNRIISLDFLREVDKLYKFYLLRGGSAPNAIYLSGAGCVTPGLLEGVSEKFALHASYLDPWEKIEVAETFGIVTKNNYSFNIALGLALYGVVY